LTWAYLARAKSSYKSNSQSGPLLQSETGLLLESVEAHTRNEAIVG
jgi:hypothetical protein